ncbi:UDP-glucuronosyltransferase 2B14-like [Photinus pyralis]|uniref:UDP-glucuronosyltransferase 2B14-like n=1 Tax=Photinus pyralis TaxID=7054 RepID=UPI0012670539|nr:UDP-glucuronosyltransferase 2B14-like [Photinus pyralis]
MVIRINYQHHQQLGNKILYELAGRGHQVTAIISAPFVPKTSIKNYKPVKFELPDYLKDNNLDFYKVHESGVLSKMYLIDAMRVFFTEMVFNQTTVQELLKSNERFDMVILEQYINEAFKGFCYHYKAHGVVVSTIGTSRWTDIQMGNPISPAYVPDDLLSYSSNMNFYQRLINSLTFLLGTLHFFLSTLPKLNEIMQKYIPGAPHLNELYYNSSLMLLNSHTSINPAVPLVPNMVEIGGFHVSSPKQLPKDLQEYLDEAKDGAIYFSMGSNLKGKYMNEDVRNAILKVFSKLKHKVLWKWEADVLPNQPKNVRLGKWFPQQDILAHPNIKLFITHGGYLSTTEAIYHGVPIVGIPIFGDQEMNVATAEIDGYGKGVSYKTLTEESFGNAVHEVLRNPKYSENVKRRSVIMHDQPMKPLDKAMYWIEYVLRHNGAPHLRTAALNLRWFQVLCLDVILFTAITNYFCCL